MYSIEGIDISFETAQNSACMVWNGNKIKTFDGLTYR